MQRESAQSRASSDARLFSLELSNLSFACRVRGDFVSHEVAENLLSILSHTL